MMKMKIMLAASILCAMTTTCAGTADMTDNIENMAGFPPISSINIPKDDNILSAVSVSYTHLTLPTNSRV